MAILAVFVRFVINFFWRKNLKAPTSGHRNLEKPISDCAISSLAGKFAK